MIFRSRHVLTSVFAAGALALVACSAAPEADPGGSTSSSEAVSEVLHGNPFHGTRDTAGKHGGSTGGLIDHGGPVTPTFHYYLVMWGTGFESTTQSLYESFLGGLGQSGYWSINTQYLRGAANSASFAKTYTDTSAPPSTVTDADLQAEVQKITAANGTDLNGLYYVITPKNVQVCSGSSCSCTQFCGYHSHYAAAGGNVLYATIPSAAACPSACSVFASDAASPNGNLEADSGVSILAHEGEETQSDSLGTAWYDRRGYENADKCAWKFGTTTTTSNGAQVNQSWGGYQWLVQMNWSNQISGCAENGPTG